MRRVLKAVAIAIACGIGLGQAAPAAAQTEQQLRQAFEGQFVIVRVDMPATHRGVDLYPDREPAVDFAGYGARLREFGISLREGARVLVTAVRVKKKNIEFHLAGGGYGVWGDDTGSVYVPTVSKSGREKDLERSIKNARDADRRRRMQRELDQLRRDREREERDRESEKRDLEARKKDEISDKRLDAGSRVNVWLSEEALEVSAPTPIELQRMLAPVIDFGGDDPRPDADTRAAGGSSGAGEPDGNVSDLRRGLGIDDVHELLGKPVRTKSGTQGDLATLTEWYERDDRVTEVVYVAAVVIRFTTSSR